VVPPTNEAGLTSRAAPPYRSCHQDAPSPEGHFSIVCTALMRVALRSTDPREEPDASPGYLFPETRRRSPQAGGQDHDPAGLHVAIDGHPLRSAQSGRRVGAHLFLPGRQYLAAVRKLHPAVRRALNRPPD